MPEECLLPLAGRPPCPVRRQQRSPPEDARCQYWATVPSCRICSNFAAPTWLTYLPFEVLPNCWEGNLTGMEERRVQHVSEPFPALSASPPVANSKPQTG